MWPFKFHPDIPYIHCPVKISCFNVIFANTQSLKNVLPYLLFFSVNRQFSFITSYWQDKLSSSEILANFWSETVRWFAVYHPVFINIFFYYYSFNMTHCKVSFVSLPIKLVSLIHFNASNSADGILSLWNTVYAWFSCAKFRRHVLTDKLF